jgi:DNA protecting protein DprA
MLMTPLPAIREPAHWKGSTYGPEHLAFLALTSIKGVGSKTLISMANDGMRFQDALAVDEKDAAIELLRRFGARIEGSASADWGSVRERAAERARQLAIELTAGGTTLILRGDSTFPTTLLDLRSPPHWLFVKGSVEVLRKNLLTVVGTRNPSADGLWLGGFVGACLERWDAPTVSGLAIGIDQLIHEWSLRAGVPTVAVLGTGILSDYPKGAAELREKIIDAGGALLTEYLPRESYSADNFVRRNRIQAALGRILVPVEWSARGGTAHTIRFATTLKRPIAYLRMPDWTPERIPVSKDCGQETGEIFTVPGEENEFRTYVARALAPVSTSHLKPQLSLFAE